MTTTTTCPGCGSDPKTCGCVPGLDYPEAAPADDAAAEGELGMDVPVLDVSTIDLAWIEEQVEKRLSLLAERERLREQYNARAEAKDREIAEHQASTQYMLEAWFDAQPKGNVRYIDVATGRLRRKLNRGGPRVADEAEALAWAEANKPELVTPVTTKKLDKKALCAVANAALIKDGELLPGIEFKEDWESFFIEAPKASGEEI